MRRNSIFILMLAAMTASASAAGEGLTLDQLTTSALTRHGGLKAALATIQASEAALRQARYLQWPTLSARSRWTRGDNPVYVFGSLLEQGRFGPANFAIDRLNNPGDLSNVKSGLDLGLPLFTGYERPGAIQLSESAEQAARLEFDLLTQRLRFDVAQLYIRLKTANRLDQILSERIDASIKEAEEARRLKERGLVLGSDYYAAESILSGLKAWRLGVRADGAAARAALAVLTGTKDLQISSRLPENTYGIPSLDDLTADGLRRRPELLEGLTRIESASINTKLAGRTIYPRVNAFASLETNTKDFDSNPLNHLYGIEAQMRFGDAGYASRRREASARREAETYDLQSLQDLVRSDIAQAWERYQGALAQRQTTKETAALAAKSLELFRPLYRNGRQSILEVLRAEDALARAEASDCETLSHIHLGYLQLMHSAGRLDEKAVMTLSKTLEAIP